MHISSPTNLTPPKSVPGQVVKGKERVKNRGISWPDYQYQVRPLAQSHDLNRCGGIPFFILSTNLQPGLFSGILRYPEFPILKKVGLCDLHRPCIPPCPISFRMPEPIFMKLRLHIMTPESMSMAYFINPISLCLHVYPLYPCFAMAR
jgi:hypothetical protein